MEWRLERASTYLEKNEDLGQETTKGARLTEQDSYLRKYERAILVVVEGNLLKVKDNYYVKSYYQNNMIVWGRKLACYK